MMADYFEQVKWQRRFDGESPASDALLGPRLPIATSSLTLAELRRALGKLKAGKAAGPDDVPPDFWKAVAEDDLARGILLRICQQCWEKKAIPESRRRARAVLLFKKGDATLPANYRPISSLPVGYKVLASMLHHRLIGGGADARMRNSQYVVRPGRGPADALMLVRRMIDAAHNSNSGGILLLMLDWAKAFD